MAVQTVGAQDFAAFREGLMGNIHPQGWLLEFLDRQATGLTGHPEAMAYPYNTCLWAGEIERQNENPDAKDWWRYEQTAYYTDGLLRLGYLLGNEDFIQTGENGIAYTIEHKQSNGRLGNAKIESLWPMAVFFRAMQAHYFIHRDPAIIEALENHYLSLNTTLLTDGRRHIVNLEGMLFVYGITKNPQLLSMAEAAYNKGGFELDAAVAGSQGSILLHGVTYAEMLKIPLLLYAYTGNQRYLDLAMNAERKLERDHLLPDGLYTSAESTMGNDIDYAHETCDITDYTWSLGYFLQVTGEAEWADRLERATMSAGSMPPPCPTTSNSRRPSLPTASAQADMSSPANSGSRSTRRTTADSLPTTKCNTTARRRITPTCSTPMKTPPMQALPEAPTTTSFSDPCAWR